MPVLTNVRWELLARALAQGRTHAEAGMDAGYKDGPGLPAQISRLSKKDNIARRIAELQREAATPVVERMQLDREWVLSRLRKVAERSMEDETFNGNVANRALELIGKEVGMFREPKTEEPTDTPANLTDIVSAARARLERVQ